MAEPLVTRRGTLDVPTFLPDATRAGVRGVSSDDLRRIGIDGVVVNAFHLLRRPGARVVQAAGGIHRFMDWDRADPVSDSGGFQIWSLIRQDPNRGVIRDNEVIFREPSTGEKWNLTPERVMGLQLQLGSDIVVCLDDCTDADAPESEQERSVERTVRWARRCRDEFDRLVAERRDADPPRIIAVVQGGGIERLRRECAAALHEIGFDGYGFGGWPLDADGGLLTDPMRWVAESLPVERPEARAGRRQAGPRRQRLRARILDLRLRAADARRATRPSVRVPRRVGRPPAVSRATPSTAPCASMTRTTASTTGRSRRAATARSARATRRPTCITCSRSATCRRSGWPPSTTCASTSACSTLLRG